MPEIIIPTKNVNLEKLGLINRGLFPVDNGLALRYNAVLKKVFSLDCDVDSFRVDKRGLSPELSVYFKKKYPERFEFGENYLNMRSANRFMIVVSPDQKSCPLVAPQTSYEDSLYEEVYRQARHTIEDVTGSEAIFGELENGISMFNSAEDLLQLRTVEVTLDTLEETVKSYFELKKMADDLGKGNNALDPEYIDTMQEKVKKEGDIRKRNISKVFPVTKEIHCFSAEFFKGVHCLRNFKGRQDIRTLFITHHQKDEKYWGEEVVTMDLHDESLIDVLHKYKFLGYNPNLVDQRIQELEDESLLSQGLDIVDMKPWERKKQVVECVKKFPESWHELREISALLNHTRNGIGGILENKSYATKLKLSEAIAKPEIVNHMLAELDPTDPVRVYEFNRRKLVTEFPNMPANRQRYVAYRLLTQLNQQGGKTK
jgi:hypothetical protein